VRDGVLRFQVPASGAAIELGLFDILGRKVAEFDANSHDVQSGVAEWRISPARSVVLAPGAYFIRGRVGAQQVQQKVVVLGR
jgi:hypothetical protein